MWTYISERYLELSEEEDEDLDSDAESGLKEWYN